jgi:hypothetical protein
VRAGTSKSTGYDNPLYASGDVLVDREAEAAGVMPLVVGDHAVVTPRRPESPLVSKLKAQASEKNHRLRQDRILVRFSSSNGPEHELDSFKLEAFKCRLLHKPCTSCLGFLLITRMQIPHTLVDVIARDQPSLRCESNQKLRLPWIAHTISVIR